MKASTVVSSSSSVSSHKSAAPPLAFSHKIVTFFLSGSRYSPRRLIFVVLPPVPDASSFTPCIPRSSSLYWFTNVCSGIFLSFILKTLRLPRNFYLCTARAMPAVEGISCKPSTSSSEGHCSSSCPIAAPSKAAYKRLKVD